jgi:peptidylprolyl isomerase
MEKVRKGHYVKVHYTGELDNGVVFDSSRDCDPFEVHVGEGQVLAGFEDALLDMALKEEKTFRLTAEEAYGIRDEELQRTISRVQLPPDFDPKVGEVLALRTPEGQQVPAIVQEADAENIVVDMNHPLAGEALVFHIEVVDISDLPSPQNESGCSCECSCDGSCG